MPRNTQQDIATFEEIASDILGTDMSGWVRAVGLDRPTDGDYGVTRLVFAVDADGRPLPPPGERPEGYTLGSVLIVSIGDVEYGGVRPIVQINAWNLYDRRLIDVGHSKPSIWELEAITGGNPDWLEDPDLVGAVLAEYEDNLPDAIADAVSQIATDGRLPVAPQALWADSLGTANVPDQTSEDPWEDSRGYTWEPPIQELPPEHRDDAGEVHEAEPWVPDGYTEAQPWAPDGYREAEPWDESMEAAEGTIDAPQAEPATDDDAGIDWDTWEAYPGEREKLALLDGPRLPAEESTPIDEIGEQTGDAGSTEPSSDTDDDVDWDSYESYPGEKALFDELDGPRLPPEESTPIDEIGESVDEGVDAARPTARPTTAYWAGTTSGRIWTGSNVRAMFTDADPKLDPSTRQPLSVISGQITTSSGETASVRLYLLSHTPGGPAVYGSQLLTMGGKGTNHLPGAIGDSVALTVGGRTDTIGEIFDHPLKMTHAIQKERLVSAGFMIAEMRRQYLAATEGREGDLTVRTNRQYFDESLRTIQMGIEHADDAENLKEKVASTQYYLDHTVLNMRSMRDLAEGRIMWNPYHDDIRETTTYKHAQSMLSFYQNDVVIREHFTTLVEDAAAYGEFMRSDAVGKHFDTIAISILQASYDPLIGKTPMSWLYPILSYAVTGTFTDHHGKEMSPGAVAALGIDVILKSVDVSKRQLAKTGRYTPGRSGMDYGEAALLSEIGEAFTDKGVDGAKGLASAGVGALIDHEYAQADAAARGTDGTPTPPPPATPPEPTTEGAKGVSTGVKVGIGAVAVAAVIGGGLFIAGNSGGDATAASTTSQPPAVVQQEDPAPSEDPPPAQEEPDPGTGDPPPQLDAPEEPLDDELFEFPVPERDPGSLDAPTYDGPTAQEILLLPPPEPTTSDDEQRRGGGSLYVDATYVVDWQADIIVENGRITPGGLFPAGSGWRGEYLILADCTGDTCVYSTPLAHGDTMVFTQAGNAIYGTSNDLSGGCDRDIFIAFRVSDFQTINGRLVPDAIHGARIETGMCETAVYREIVYDGGFEFIGSFNDQ